MKVKCSTEGRSSGVKDKRYGRARGDRGARETAAPRNLESNQPPMTERLGGEEGVCFSLCFCCVNVGVAHPWG